MRHIKFSDFLDDLYVYPEYTNLTINDYLKLSDGKSIIGGLRQGDFINTVLVKNGQLLDTRSKVTPTSSEINDGVKPGDQIRTFAWDDYTILPIICFEICFPELYYNISDKVDLITHHVGFPMFNQYQYTAWNALQKAVCEHFHAPIVSVCGGPSTKLNITQVIRPVEIEKWI